MKYKKKKLIKEPIIRNAMYLTKLAQGFFFVFLSVFFFGNAFSPVFTRKDKAPSSETAGMLLSCSNTQSKFYILRVVKCLFQRLGSTAR